MRLLGRVVRVVAMSDFLQDIVINRLNGYYLHLYANDRRKAAFFIGCLNHTFASLMAFAGLIPPRIRYK